MRVVTVATTFPDQFNPAMAPWSKYQVDSVNKYSNIEIEIVVPRPYALPIKFITLPDFNKLPIKSKSDLDYIIHHPRFLYIIPKKLFFGLTGNLYSFFISNYILKNITKPDIIHARFSYLDGFGVIKACKKWNIPLVFDVHGDEFFEYFNRLRQLKKKNEKTISYAKKILCVAEWQVRKGLKIGIPKEKLECVPLGIDINKFKPRNKKVIRNEFRIREKITILSVGQLIKRKDIETLLKAVCKLDIVYRKKIKVVIIGSGSEKSFLHNLTNKLNLEDIVTFLEKVPEDDLLKWYSLADIFVLSSLSEGRPTVINEAMASECAVVATNVSGIPEQIEDRYNGFLVEPKNPDMLAEKISYLLADEEKMTRMGKNGRKRIIENDWTFEGYAKRITSIYKKLIV